MSSVGLVVHSECLAIMQDLVGFTMDLTMHDSDRLGHAYRRLDHHDEFVGVVPSVGLASMTYVVGGLRMLEPLMSFDLPCLCIV